MSLDHMEAHLAAEARYASERVALYKQRLYVGSGELRRLGELERVASGAAERLAHHRATADESGKTVGLRANLGLELDEVRDRRRAATQPPRRS